MRIISQRHIVFLALALSFLGPTAPRADEWPTRPITLVVSTSAGDVSDYVGRELAQSLSTALGQKIVIENKAGGGGLIAPTSVAKAPPDGYTLLSVASGPAIIRPIFDKKSPVHVQKEFDPIIITGEVPNILVTNSKHDFKTVQDVIAYAKQNPGQLTIGHPGIGTVGHLVGLLFAAEAGIEANFISYSGRAPLMTDLFSEQIDLGSIAFTSGIGDAKILAITSNEKIGLLPDVPTMKESGLPNVIGATWIGVFAPKGTPPNVISKLNSAIENVLKAESTKSKFNKIGFRIIGGSPDQMRAQMIDEHVKWSKIIEAAKISIEQ